jgi:hypothetical protein
MDKFKESNPVEAAALEREFAALFEEASNNHDTDPWCVKLFSRYPSRDEWQVNPDRCNFIHDLFEESGFRVRRNQCAT